MSINDTISGASEQFSKGQTAIVTRLVDELLELSDTLSREDLLQVVSTIDIEAYVLDELGYAGEIDKLMLNYEALLIDTPFFANVKAETLEALATLDKATYFAQASQLSSKVRLEVMKGAIAGKSQNDIKKSILGMSDLRKDQAQVLASSSMRNFSRSVIKNQMDDAPDDKLYIYAGVIDDRTRDVCLDMGSAGALTQSEIESRWGGGVLVDGGGWNCRHRWTPQTSQSGKLTDKSKAKDFIEDKDDFNPVTLEDLYKNKA